MKKARLMMILVLLFSLQTVEARHKSIIDDHHIQCLKNVDIDVEGRVVVIRNKGRSRDRDCIEITEDNELYVNGRLVRTRRIEARLTRDYYQKVMDIWDEARRIGLRGAEVGMEGARIGLKAVAGLVRLLDPDYTSEDLERELERETRRLERKAESLEEDAEDLEDMADDLERLHYKMRRTIPEIKELRWF